MQNMLEMNYYATYYYSNIIENVLRDPFPYVRNLNDFYGDGKLEYMLVPFQKNSTFHQFIYFIIEDLINSNFPEDPHCSRFHLHDIFKYHNLEYMSYDNWRKQLKGDLSSYEYSDYYSDLCMNGEIDNLLSLLTDEVFFVMFMNRQALLNFNTMMAGIIEMTSIEELIDNDNKKHFSKDGVLKRTSIPQWVKDAVFFRDRGHCTNCNKDLSGILSRQNVENYDHIVPLALGGMNDVSNIQLLCDNCNLTKLAKPGTTNNNYEKWY